MPVIDKVRNQIENNGYYSLIDENTIRSTWLYKKDFTEEIIQGESESGIFHYLDEQLNIEGGNLLYRYQLDRSASMVNDILSLLDTLTREGIIVHNPGEVSSYLFQYPDMAYLVLEICRFTAGHFSGNAELTIELYRDPEQEDNYLTLYVRQEIYDETIMERIDSISDKFEESLNQSRGWMIVTTDFQLPRSV